MSNEELKYLSELLLKLNKASDTLRYSYKVCSGIGIKTSYDEEEKDRFESLTSKFARLSDLIIKQCIKTIDILDLDEAPETVRDAINRAEKKGIVSSAETFVDIRKLRNAISHEYAVTDLDAIYIAVLKHVPELFDSVERIYKYTEKFICRRSFVADIPGGKCARLQPSFYTIFSHSICAVTAMFLCPATGSSCLA